MCCKRWLLSAIAAFLLCPPLLVSASEDETHDGGRIVQSLFRFPASRLGPEFNELLNLWYKDELHASINESNSNATNLPKITPEPAGIEHSTRAVTGDAATLFRRQCYGPAPESSQQMRNLYANFEQRRKEIEFQYIRDPMEEMKILHTMVRRFYPAFLPAEGEDNKSHQKGATQIHKKKSKSTANTVYADTTPINTPASLAFQTFSKNDDDNSNSKQKWTWRPPGHFSSRGAPDFVNFRKKFFFSMREKFQDRLLEHGSGLEMARQSGMFWYPPGGVREWHNNYLDLVGSMKRDGGGRPSRNEEIFASQVWRMYYVRVVRDEKFDEKLADLRKSTAETENAQVGEPLVDKNANDHSAMHIIAGGDTPGISLEVLKKAGARPLTKEEKMRQWTDVFAEGYSNPPANDEEDQEKTTMDHKSVWRVPDEDGYVTLFRLPDLWHCIVSEEVHRFSLGFAFSDNEVQTLLKLAGEEFDIERDGAGADEKQRKSEETKESKDEL